MSRWNISIDNIVEMGNAARLGLKLNKDYLKDLMQNVEMGNAARLGLKQALIAVKHLWRCCRNGECSPTGIETSEIHRVSS